MKAIFSFLAATLCAISPLFAQAPAIQWQNTIGGSNYDILYSLQQTADGGYILGGDSRSNISGDKTENSWGVTDYWVLKLDTTGTIQWQNTIGGDGEDDFRSIQQTADGGYILGGYSNSNISGDKTENNLGQFNDYWVIKLDSAGAIQWQNTIGGDSDDFLLSLQQTADGGYILGGASNSNISGDKTENSNGIFDYWVVKLNATGAIQWQNTIGGNYDDELYSLQQTADGGYILGGHSNSNISGDKTENSNGYLDYWVVRLNATGTIQWQNTIGGNNQDHFSSLQQTSDGGYILGGYSYSNISGDKTENSLGYDDYWIIKLDAKGTIQWQNTIGGDSFDELTSLQQTADGGYILGGRSYSDISGDKTENSNGGEDCWVVKLDTTGTIQWQNTIGGNDIDILRSLRQTADGGFILGGTSTSNISGDKTENSWGGRDYWVVKLDATGAIQWQNTIGGNGYDFLSSLQQTADGGYILGGHSDSNISGDKTENNIGGTYEDYWVVKLDTAGNILWQNTIGGNGYDELTSLQQTADGGYILGGSSWSNISGDKTENSWGQGDYWVIKLAPETVPTGEAPALAGVTIYPNPAADAIFVRADTETTLNLYNAIGQTLLTQTLRGNGKIDLSSLPNGIYFLVEMETGIGHKILKNE